MGMKKLMVCVSLCVALLLCANVYAATPYETRTAWLGGTLWVDSATGATVFLSDSQWARTDRLGVGHSNAIYIKNDDSGGSGKGIFINWNGKEDGTGSGDPASANTSDFELLTGEEIWVDPFTATRLEVTASSGDLVGVKVKYLILYAD